MSYLSTVLSIALVVGFCCGSAAGDGTADDRVERSDSGTLPSDLLKIRWKLTGHSANRPELVFLLENDGEDGVVARFEWTPRICDGRVARADSRTAQLLRDRIGMGFPRRNVRPGDWQVIELPLGLRFLNGEEQIPGCVTRVRIVVTVPGKAREETMLVVPLEPKAETNPGEEAAVER